MSEPRMTHDEAIEMAGLYVLHALEPGEEAAVRAHLATCPLAHDEFEAVGGVVPALIEAGLDGLEPVEPPAALRDRILAAAAADRAAPDALPSRIPSRPSPDPIPLPSAPRRTARAERGRTRPFDWALRIAAVIAIVAAGAYGLAVQSQLDTARQFDQAVAAVVQAGSQPSAKTVVLATQKDQRGAGIGAVRADGSVVLALRDLTATSGEQSYTAWVIVGSNAPVNVGDFAVGGSGVGSFTTKPAQTPPGATIAVTLEAKAGHAVPAGPIVVAGQAAAPPPANG